MLVEQLKQECAKSQGARLKQVREGNNGGISQRVLADKLDVHIIRIKGYESGTMSIPSNILPLISMIFHCSINFLLDDSSMLTSKHLLESGNEAAAC